MIVITKRTRAHYPFVVEPLGDRWQVMYVKTDRPYRVSEFHEREKAFVHMRGLNRQWWQELHALDQARRVIERVRETSAPRHAVVVRASLWTRLKTALRLR